jgi:D-psicose/D-tagatose/L-ribulose 3-epimerase
MKLGVSTYIWSAACDQTVRELFPLIKKKGFDGVEVPLFRAQEFPAAELRKAAKENELECNAGTVLVDGLSLIADDAALRRKTVSHLKDLIQAAAEGHVGMIAGPIYSPVGFLSGRRRTEDEWKWAVEGYHLLGDTLTSYNIALAIEPLNRFETFFLNTAADAAKLAELANHPKVGILFDTFHANIEEKDVAAGFRTVGRHLKHVHASENDRGIPGSGHVNWPSVFQVLQDLKYDGWLTIESFGFALGDLSAAAAIWRDIEKTPESIAFEGIRFLKQSLASSNSDDS